MDVPIRIQTRAMLYPLFRQARAQHSSIDKELELTLQFWLEALMHRLCQLRPWVKEISQPAYLFCDSRSVPPRLVAVLTCDRGVYYSGMQPSSAVMRSLAKRGDRQIMSLELLSIAFGTRASVCGRRGRQSFL